MENKTIFWTLGLLEWMFLGAFLVTDNDVAAIGTFIFGAAGLIVLNNNLQKQ